MTFGFGEPRGIQITSAMGSYTVLNLPPKSRCRSEASCARGEIRRDGFQSDQFDQIYAPPQDKLGAESLTFDRTT